MTRECKNYIEVRMNQRHGLSSHWAKIDKKDRWLLELSSWSYTATTRRPQGFVNGKVSTIHQLLLPAKKGLVIDHVNHDAMDNRRFNLRYATKSQNGMNQARVSGVTLCKKRDDTPNWKKRWLMQIQYRDVKGEKVRKYSFHYTKKEAVEARKKAELELFGDFRFRGT